jgi:AraC family transcriptional regulator
MKDVTLRIYKERLLRALVYIQQHLDEEIELEALARVSHFSPYHFHRIFRGMMGESVKEHIRRLRLERAAVHLKHSRRSVTRIAFESGYESHEAFTRAFRLMFGESPSGFRARRGTALFIETPSGVHFRANGRVNQFRTSTKGWKTMDVRIKRVEPMRVAFVRHVGPYIACGKAWEALCEWAGRKGLLVPGATFLGLSYDDPGVTPEEKLRYDACLVVDDGVEAEGDVGIQEIHGGEYAVITHKGPYENLNKTYARIMGEWLPRSGREASANPSFEKYLNFPDDTAPEDLVTEIHVPLAE